MDDGLLCVRQAPHEGIELGEFGAQHQHDIRAFKDRAGPHITEHTDHTSGQRMAFIHHTLAIDTGDDGRAELFREAEDFRARLHRK